MSFLFLSFVLFIVCFSSSNIASKEHKDQTNLNYFLSFFINKGDLVYDVNSHSGEYFKLLGLLVGRNGNIVGFERNVLLFESLKEKAMEADIWDRSLLLNSNPGDFTSSMYNLSSEQSPITMDDIHQILGGFNCPSFLKISGLFGESDEWVTIYEALIGSASMIDQCRPVVLLETSLILPKVQSQFRSVTFNFLTKMVSVKYDLFWLFNAKNIFGRILIAVPKLEDKQLSVTALMTEGILTVVSDIDLTDDVSVTADSISCCASLTGTSRGLVDSDFLVESNSKKSIVNLHISSSVSVGHDQRLLITAAECFLWVRRAVLLRADIVSQPSSLLQYHDECSAFVHYRFEFFERLHLSRAALSVATTQLSDPPAPRYSHYEDRVDGIVGAWGRKPFEIQHEPDVCAEPVWCAHTVDMQRRIRLWQFPEEDESSDERNRTAGSNGACQNAKFLVFEPPSDLHGIGSLLQVTAAAFRYAVCLDRIFVMSAVGQQATLSKWRHPGCGRQSTFECYFQTLHGCGGVLSQEDVESATNSSDGFGFDSFPARTKRVLVLRGLPLSGDCQLCHSAWPTRSRFFDGLFVGGLHDEQPDMDLLHATAFMAPIKLTYVSIFLRFLMRPRPWFADLISDVVQLSMYSPLEKEHQEKLALSLLPSVHFPRHFVSLHVRFGMKSAEVALHPLARYMSVLQRKLPWARDVFVSTETESVIHTLVREYPDLRFHYLRYHRLEYLNLNSSSSGNGTDFVSEFVMSMANLFVSSQAGGFVGTLSSNWCTCIHHLERSRGDGGYDYLSVDSGSAFTSCF